MTSFVVWTGIDDRAPSSIYFASDSRISISSGRSWTWDFGRKVFASRRYPDIFGYVGDVLFPSQILGQIVDLIDAGILFSPEDNPPRKMEKVMGVFSKTAENYPFVPQVHIIYASRLDIAGKSSLRSSFRLFQIYWENGKWSVERIGMPLKSHQLLMMGSGAKDIQGAYNKWQSSPHKDTSRAVFSAFCDGLESTTDSHSGGAPQLVGIHRKGTGKYFGVVYRNQTYFLGLPVSRPNNSQEIEWFNDLFEMSSGKTRKRLPDAQKHEDISY